MSEPSYEKIGAVVFGMHRLDMVMTGLTAWMGKHQANDKAPFSLQKIDAFATAGGEYFNRYPNAKAADQFDLALRNLKIIAQLNQAMQAGQELLNIDDAVQACNDAHQLVAEVIRAVGYSEVPPAFLSDRKFSV